MAESSSKTTYSMDPTLFLYTSLTSGSSHIVTATSRMETILKANRIPFRAIDIATDEKARMLWGRRAGKDESGRQRKIPGLVQEGFVVGDLVEVEDWNEYGELKQHVKIVPVPGQTLPPVAPGWKGQGQVTTSTVSESKKLDPTPVAPPKEADPSKPAATPISLALKQVGGEAAQKAKESKKKGIEKSYDGVGEAEPVEKSIAKLAVTPAPIKIADKSTVNAGVGPTSSIQSPNSTAWKGAKTTTPRHPIEGLQSLQSPTSTTWKPTDVDAPILTHRGSTLSNASAEEIKQVEEEATIKEEDEEDEEDEEEDEDGEDGEDEEDEEEEEDDDEKDEEENGEKSKG